MTGFEVGSATSIDSTEDVFRQTIQLHIGKGEETKQRIMHTIPSNVYADSEPCFGSVALLVPDSPFCRRSIVRGLLCYPSLRVFGLRCLFVNRHHLMSLSSRND